MFTLFTLLLWLKLCTKTVPNTSKSFKNDSNTLFATQNQNYKIRIENYAYGYHSSSTVIDGCSFGSSHWHLISEDTCLEDKNAFSPYASVPIPCLLTCFKFLILPTEKNFVTRGAIVSRLHVAVEYLSKFNHVSTNKTNKQLPLPNPVKKSQPLLQLLTNMLLLSPM